MEKLCKNCTYYNKESLFKSSCDCEKFITGYHIELDKIEEDEILVESDEGWAFMPRENFGCIHFKEESI